MWFERDFLALDLTPIQRLTYMFLWESSSDDGTYFSTTFDLANSVGCSRASISKAISVLTTKNLLDVRRPLFVGGVNSYILTRKFNSDITHEINSNSNVVWGIDLDEIENNRPKNIVKTEEPTLTKKTSLKRDKSRSIRKKKKKNKR